MIHEVKVLRLEWHGGEDRYLVHSMVIKKKYDACDIEHGLCAISGLLMNARSCRNMSKENNINEEKYHPIRVTTGVPIAQLLPLMKEMGQKYPSVLESYWFLLSCDDHEHQILYKQFGLDVI